MPTASERHRIYAIRKQLELQGVKEWAQIYDEFPSIPKNQVRKIFYRERLKQEGAQARTQPSLQVHGVKPVYSEYDEDEVWQQAIVKSRRKKFQKDQGNKQSIEFSHGPVCLVFLADLHVGDVHVDYERLDEDIETIVGTPGMYVCAIGDMLNNYIVGRLKDLRLGSEFSISEEWVMVKRVLKALAPKLVLSVAGNHDLWTFALTGVDYLEEVHARMNPDILYAKYDNQVSLQVGEERFILRARHKWKGYSQYNPTHGVEWAAKFDHAEGRHFDVGIAAHTHVSGLYRQFNNGGRTGHAVVCGSYKFYDEYAVKMGYPEPNEAAAVALIVNDDGSVFGTNNLDAASMYMKAMYH